MRRLAIINQKGGVGKTTTTVNLGAALAQSGARVLLIDLDPQGHLTLHAGREVTDGDSSVYDVLISGTPVLSACMDVSENLKLLPADIDLAAAESELVSVTGREVVLREAIDAVGDEFDYLLVDCPPSLGVLTVNALVACSEVVVPLQTQFFALQGLSRLFDTIMLVKQRINPGLSVLGVVLCMHEAQTRLGNEVVDDLRRFLDSGRGGGAPWAKARIFNTCIRRNIKLAEASGFGQSIFDYAPRSNGALDYADLTDEIFGAPAALVTRDRHSAAEPVEPNGDETESTISPTADRRAGWSSAIQSASTGANGRLSSAPSGASPLRIKETTDVSATPPSEPDRIATPVKPGPSTEPVEDASTRPAVALGTGSEAVSPSASRTASLDSDRPS